MQHLRMQTSHPKAWMGTASHSENESEFWPRGERSVEAEVKLSSSLPLPDKLSAAALAHDALACAVVYVLYMRIHSRSAVHLALSFGHRAPTKLCSLFVRYPSHVPSLIRQTQLQTVIRCPSSRAHVSSALSIRPSTYCIVWKQMREQT